LLPYEEFKKYYNNYISLLPSNPTVKDFLDLNEFQRTNPTDTDIVPRYISKDGIVERDNGIFGISYKYWNVATTFMNENLKTVVQEGKNKMENEELDYYPFPKLINVGVRSRAGQSDIISWQWDDVILTPEEIRAKKPAWKKKQEMKDRGDYSFKKRGLFKKVYEVNDNGDLIPLRIYNDPKKILYELDKFKKNYVNYNPRNNYKRKALSILNHNGNFDQGPDVDSLHEYNKEHSTNFKEIDFKTATTAYYIFKDYLELWRNNAVRARVLQINEGGYFPPHRDNRRSNIKAFRIIVPIENCNPPNCWFILEDKPLQFEHGRAYILNQCKQHTLFNVSENLNMSMLAFSVRLDESTLDIALNKIW